MFPLAICLFSRSWRWTREPEGFEGKRCKFSEVTTEDNIKFHLRASVGVARLKRQKLEIAAGGNLPCRLELSDEIKSALTLDTSRHVGKTKTN
jgi:hypothetical protein